MENEKNSSTPPPSRHGIESRLKRIKPYPVVVQNTHANGGSNAQSRQSSPHGPRNASPTHEQSSQLQQQQQHHHHAPLVPSPVNLINPYKFNPNASPLTSHKASPITSPEFVGISPFPNQFSPPIPSVPPSFAVSPPLQSSGDAVGHQLLLRNNHHQQQLQQQQQYW